MEVSSRYRLQNIVRCYKKQLFAKPLPLKQTKAIEAIVSCQTEERGVSAYECEHEDKHQTLIAHSCRHRSCALCAERARVRWLEEQKRRLLNCPHFHCVFTLPQEYRVLWQYNQKWFVAAHFEVVRSVLMDMLKNKTGDGVVPGLLMAMHTWGRQLTLHPHVHCIVTAGGLSSKGEWRKTGSYLLPVRQVKALYRGRFQARIKGAYEKGELMLPDDHDDCRFRALYKKAYAKDWCIRIEEQYAHGKGVLIYLSRYLRGGPIHPTQIIRCDYDGIGFLYKDHREKRTKLLTLKPEEFLRRLLMHVPEQGQHMVRHYGLYAAAAKKKRAKCKGLLGEPANAGDSDAKDEDEKHFCRQCRLPMRRIWTQLPDKRKGNSFKEEYADIKTRLVQQIDEPDIGQDKKKIMALRL